MSIKYIIAIWNLNMVRIHKTEFPKKMKNMGTIYLTIHLMPFFRKVIEEWHLWLQNNNPSYSILPKSDWIMSFMAPIYTKQQPILCHSSEKWLKNVIYGYNIYKITTHLMPFFPKVIEEWHLWLQYIQNNNPSYAILPESHWRMAFMATFTNIIAGHILAKFYWLVSLRKRIPHKSQRRWQKHCFFFLKSTMMSIIHGQLITVITYTCCIVQMLISICAPLTFKSDNITRNVSCFWGYNIHPHYSEAVLFIIIVVHVVEGRKAWRCTKQNDKYWYNLQFTSKRQKIAVMIRDW